MIKKLFHFQICKETGAAFAAGAAMILLSCAMNLFPDSTIAAFLLRDLLMIFALGFVFPLYYTLIRQKQDLASIGVSAYKWKKSLIINVVLAILLLFSFLSEKQTALHFSYRHLFAITYIFAAGIFEMLFIYGFLRAHFEKAFGIIPSIILTALFYSLHHAGFQPEFVKLFFVGVMYASVFYTTSSLLAIFPFFWGVGAVWDVLVNSTAGDSLTNTASFAISIFLFCIMFLYAKYITGLRQKQNFP